MEVPEEPYTIPIGKAAVKREGKDITIVAWSFMVSKAMDASKDLEKQGISCEVIDLRTVSPLDEETILKSVAKTNRLLIVQEGYRHSSVATDVSALVAEKGFDNLDAPITLITAKDFPIPFAPIMENYVLPQTQDIVERVKQILNKV
jgi:pyruvate dehydrogenase E1 component beta subunit